MLDERGGRHGPDGSTWRFAGRRGFDFHYITRWSPDDTLWDLGRFFDVAGLAEVRLYSVTRLQGDTASRIEVLAPAASRKMEGAACRRKARHSFGVPIACLTTSIISWGRTGFIIS